MTMLRKTQKKRKEADRSPASAEEVSCPYIDTSGVFLK